MGTLENLEIGEVLTVKTYKIVPDAPIAWANTYEVAPTAFADNVTASSTALSDLCDIVAAFERGVLNAAYILDRIVVSTYVPDGTPYNPFNFFVKTYNQNGQYLTPGNPLLPLQFCTLVKRVVTFGRLGNILFRGIVAANDVNITSSGAKIQSSRLSAINNALQQFLTNLNNYGFKIVMARGSQVVETSTLREVTALNAKQTMTFKQVNNRYFDRTRQ